MWQRPDMWWVVGVLKYNNNSQISSSLLLIRTRQVLTESKNVRKEMQQCLKRRVFLLFDRVSIQN